MIRRLLVAAVLFVIIYAIFFGALNALQIIPGPLTQILTPIFSALGSILYFLREFARPNPPQPTGLPSTGHAGAPIWKHTLYYFINFLLVNVLVILPGSTIGIIYYAQAFVCRPSPTSNNSIGVGIAQANLMKGIWESAFSGVCIGI